MNDAHYAVVVGINRYPGIRDLRKARGDAEAFRDWLLDPAGGAVPPDNVHLITASEAEEGRFADFVSARPRKDEVHTALWRIAAALKVKVDADPDFWTRSRLYFYGSGHGITPRGGAASLLMANSGAGWLGEAVELRTYLEHYTRCGTFRELVFFADCCRETSAAAVVTEPPFDRCDQPFDTSVALLGFATTLGSRAYEPEEVDAARGYFTEALLTGLRGAIPGPVDSVSLGNYVAATVRARTRAAGYPQDPVIEVDIGSPISFGTGGAAIGRKVTIRFPAGFAGRGALLDGKLAQIGSWDAAAGPWTVHLPDSLYRVVPEQRDPPVVVFAGGGFFQVAGGDRDVQL